MTTEGTRERDRLLLTTAAFDRVKDRLTDACDVIVMDGEGLFRDTGGDILAEVQPTVVWASADAYLAGTLRALLAQAVDGRRTRWVQSFSAGVDDPVFDTLLRQGARVARSDAQAVPIAEYVLAHALAQMVPLDRQAELQARREWKRTPYREVAGSHWIVVGYGSIGREILTRAKAFGAAVTVVRQQAVPVEGADKTIRLADLAEHLPDADVVALACPLTDETRHLADADFFTRLSPDALLINIGRGGLVDETALLDALDRGALRAAVLDVTEVEPLPADSRLWDHPRVRVTAHTAASGSGTMARGDALFLDNLGRYLRGEPLRNECFLA